uniref:C2H2-type domain-containing protein n=1 Tax=Balaenoptera musculus TaxID=9771 RepID=A0A8C0CTN7_BALMU
MGHPLRMDNHNQFYLSMPNRPKITYRILFCQPHSTCYCSYPHPDSLKLHRSHHSNNRPWPHIIYIILPSKLKLRASP